MMERELAERCVDFGQKILDEARKLTGSEEEIYKIYINGIAVALGFSICTLPEERRKSIMDHLLEETMHVAEANRKTRMQ